MSEEESEQAGDGTESGPLADIDIGHVARIVGGALALSLYAGWMTADLVGRWLTVPVVALLSGWLLFQRQDSHDQWVFFGYSLAALVATTPVLMILSDALSAGTYGVGRMAIVFMYANVLLVFIFATIGAVIAYVTFRFDGGTGLIERVRTSRVVARVRELPSE